MYHEADFRLDRAARKDAHAARNIAVLLAERLENAGERLLSDCIVDDDPDGAAGTVLNDQDDRALEVRVAHPGRGDQQLAGERGASRCFVMPRQRRPEEGRLQDERGDDKAKRTQPDRERVSPPRLRSGSRIARAQRSPKERCCGDRFAACFRVALWRIHSATRTTRDGTTGVDSDRLTAGPAVSFGPLASERIARRRLEPHERLSRRLREVGMVVNIVVPRVDRALKDQVPDRRA